MLNVSEFKREWNKLSLYERFQHVTIRIIILFVSLLIIYALVLAAVQIFNDFQLGFGISEKVFMQDIFGSILTILILLEFNHSIVLALMNKSSVIQAKAVVLIGILVVVRKIILIDFSSATLESLLGFAAMALSLGLLYWLLRSTNV